MMRGRQLNRDETRGSESSEEETDERSPQPELDADEVDAQLAADSANHFKK